MNERQINAAMKALKESIESLERISSFVPNSTTTGLTMKLDAMETLQRLKIILSVSGIDVGANRVSQ